MSYTRSKNPEMIRTEVTAVKLYEDFILAGIGSNLCVHMFFSVEICAERIKVLNGQRIYGIVPSKCNKKILIYGGKQFSVLSVEDCEEHETKKKFSKLFESLVVDDWILSGVWLDDEVLALLTAHSVIQKWSIKSQTLLEILPNKDNSMLYSGLLLPLEDSILGFSAIACYEVLIHDIQNEEPLHQLIGHKGVVLSISCHPEKHLIVTTSDDFTIRLWGPIIQPDHAVNTMKYWSSINIECKYVLREHKARVMRSIITHSTIISVAEDSAICHWSLTGKLLKKTMSHENARISCVDANNKNAVIGQEDGAVLYQRLITSTDYCETDIIKFDMSKPKYVRFTYKKNLLLLNDTDLVLYDVPNKIFRTYTLKTSGHKMLDMSDYRQSIAIADMNGKLDIFVETGKKEAFLINTMDTKLFIGKILSMHWTRNYLVFCSDNGVINILFSKHKRMEIHSKYVLPPCKQRWLTAASKFCNNELFVCGDRSGNVHMYTKGNENPLKSFSRLHGDYGPTIIHINTRSILTTGKDSKINKFICNYEGTEFKHISQSRVAVKWLAKFLDPYQEISCGFHNGKFVLFNISNGLEYIEIPCGTLTSWDAVTYWEHLGEASDFVYLKNKVIVKMTMHLAQFVPMIVIEGSHVKMINCLKTYKSNNHNSMFYISVGDDATLRIFDTCHVYDFRQRVKLKHLSNVLSFKLFDLGVNDFLLVTAGGNGQIVIRRMDINKYSDFPAVTMRDLIDYTIGETQEENDKRLTYFNPRIKIMDIDVIKVDNHFLVFAGCSDAVLRVFTFNYDVQIIEPGKWLIDHGEGEFKIVKEIEYHRTCILKIKCIIISNKNILITCTTSGEVAFWDVQSSNLDTEPFLEINNHKSGVNSLTHYSISDKQFLMATGGDDNTMSLNLLEMVDVNNLASLKVTQQWSSSQYHSSQITGLCFVNQYLLSVSVDQRVTLFEWNVIDEGIRCDFLSQTMTDITYVRGLEFMENSSNSITICIYGKGMEVLCIPVI